MAYLIGLPSNPHFLSYSEGKTENYITPVLDKSSQ
jgi:hypothetical protein